MKNVIAIAAAALLTTAAHAGCYTLLDGKGNVILESSTPPVDMQYQLHQTVPHRYGKNVRLVFGPSDEDCGDIVDYADGEGLKDKVKKNAADLKAREEREAARRAAMAAPVEPEAPASAASAAAAPAAEAPAPAASAAPAVAQ